MTSNLTNFVAIRQTKGDILSPAEYRSIVELIRGLLDRYNFTDLTSGYAQLLAHIADHHNPHHDGNADLFNVIVERTYAIYAIMTAHPLNLADFKTRIVPTMQFFELLRRIVLNRYLYDQIKTTNGSVPATVTVFLTSDWLGPGNARNVTLSFGGPLASESDFIKLGWGANTTPVPAIFDATFLSTDGIELPVVLETAADVVYQMIDVTGTGIPFTFPLASNDITIRLTVVGPLPTAMTTIFSFRNNDTVSDIFQINMGPDGILYVVLNDVVILQTPAAISDGRIALEISSHGFATLTTNVAGRSNAQSQGFTFNSLTTFSTGLLKIPYEDFFTSTFSLRNLVIYRGYISLLPLVPPGFVVVVDSDGSYLTDYDGSFILDVA